MPSLFFVKDGEKTMANADISLLFGVLGEGSLSGESGSLIQGQLNQIMSEINKNPFKVKVALDADSTKKSAWTAQLQRKLDALNSGNKLAVTVSDIKLGTSAITSFKNQLGAVINTLNLDKDVSVSFTAKDIGDITAEFRSASDAANEAAKKVAQFKVQMETLGAQKSSVKRQLASLGQTIATDEERAQIAAINAQYEQWAIRIETIRASKTAASATVQAELMAEGDAIRRNIDALMESAQAAQERANAESAAAQQTESAEAARMATLNEVISAYKKINDYINKNPRIAGTSQYTQLVSMRDELAGIIEESNKLSDSANDAGKNLSTMSRVDLRTMLNSLSQMDIELTEAGKKGKTFVGMLQSAYQKFGGWMLVTRSLMMMVGSFKSMVTNVVALDAAMTELRKVTDATEASYTRFFDKAITRSKQLGATLTDTITATADFARLGYSIEEAADLADAALVYKNVGDGIEDISTASESVISTMQAFGIEATNAMLIVDKFNEVGNNFAISSKGVGDALVRSAAALASAGNSLDESIALVTAANTIVQNPDVVGTTMKTVSMYLRAAKTEAEEAGESTEGMARSVSELREEILALTGNKVDIQIDNDTFKNTTQILRELSGVWEELTDVSQANLLEMIGGKRNANVVASLIENFELVEEVLESSANAAGSALAENEKYLDSINGKVSQFRAAFEALSATFINSDLVKGVVDLGTGIIETLTTIIDKLGSIPTLISTITGALTVYQKSKNGADLGLFKLVDGNIGFDPSGIRSTISEYNSLLSKTAEEQSGFISKLKTSDVQLANYLGTVKDCTASFKGYKAYCKQAGVETKTLGTTSKVASIGVTLLNTAINMLISLGITLVIQGIITALTSLANATEEAVERTEELNGAFKEFKETNADNIKTLESLKSEFDELSKGVSRYGENVALTSDEYERYKEIIETIVGISPSLSEGYDTENGYLADKNGLIERAIELQEQQYQQELRQMTSMENLKTGMEGYIATYDDLRVGKALTADTDLTNSIYQLFKINDRDVVPDFADVNGGDDKSVYLAEQIIKSLGIDNVDAEIRKYLNEHGYFQSGWFMDDYAEAIAQNYEKIAASIDYSAIGYKTKTEFDEAIGIVGDAATEYLNVQNQMAEANAGIANQLKLVAEANKDYANLSDEAQSIVSNFIDRFGVEDVYRQNFWGNWVPDEDAINSVRVQIEHFIESLTPEVQNAISGLFDLKGLFDAGDINVDEFKSTVDAIIADLEAAGFDSESVKYLRLSLETDMVDERLNAVREAIGGLEGQYDEMLGSLTSQELSYAYKIVAEEGSLTFDELMSKIEWLKYESADMVNVLDFSDMITGLSDAKDGIDSIISAMDRLNSGTAMTKEQLANLALQYPKLLEQSDLFVDGSIEGQKQLLSNILEIHEAAYNAQLDEKIAELKATEQVINDQLAMETEKANLIGEIKTISVNGVLGQEEELVNKMNQLNDLQGQNFVAMEDGMLTVNEEALNSKLGKENEYGQQAAANIWEPYARTIKSAHTEGFSASLQATNSYSTSLFSKVRSIISNVWSALGEAVKDATTGNWQGLSHYFQSAVSGVAGNTTIDAGDVTVTFDGQEAFVGETSLDAWVSQQEQASIARIEALEDLKTRTVNAYKNLEALRGLDLTGIYGSAGSLSSGSSKKDSDGDGIPDSEDEDYVKDVDEYIADIDAYYAAQKRLEELQAKRSSLEKKLKYSNDPAEKIALSSQLIDAYRDEIGAERDLMDAKRQTIMANAAALRRLGFQVEYNSDANELYIKNLEHLNELTATSAGEYDTLQEATNALRKEAEELIDVTEQLNDDNIEATESIEDLGYQVLETKNNIIDYVEEIYDKQVESYQKIIDLRKELIESAKEEYDYEADIADKVKEIAELQARIDQLALDDSRSAQAERNSLMQELAEKQQELADTQGDHATDAQLDALDKMAEDYEAQKADEIQTMRDTVTASEELWDAFYQTILGRNVTVGNSVDTEVANAWIRAAQAVNEYSSSVNGLSVGGTIITSVPKYHDGGVVDEANLGKDEALAILQKGEVVLNEGKQQVLYRIIDFQAELAKRLGDVLRSVNIPSVSTDANSLIGDTAHSIVGGSQSLVFEPHIEVAISHNGEMSDTDAESYGDKIANTTIDKLYSAFERRGINSTRGSRLKP